MTKPKTTNKNPLPRTSSRRSRYQDWIEGDGLILLEGWSRDGLTNEQIAHNIGINVRTLYEWQKKYPPIDHALKNGKEVVDRLVENALLKRALGYEYIETTTETYETHDGETRERKKEVTKQVVPDTVAQIYWLNNRKPNDWSNKRYIEQKVESTQEVTVKQDNKLEEIIEQDNQKANEIYKTLFEEYNKSNDDRNKE